MNRAECIGRICRDTELRQTADGTAVGNFTIAINRRTRGTEQLTDFIPCVAFGKTAEFAQRNVLKGRLVGVTGRIQTGNYINKDGQRINTYDVVVDDIDLLDSRPGSAPATTAAPQTATAAAQPQVQAQTQSQSQSQEFMAVPDGVEAIGLPFT